MTTVFTHQDTVATATPTIPTVTPPADNELIIAFVLTRDATAGAQPTFTPPATGGWVEDIERYSNVPGLPNVGAYICHLPLGAGSAGVATGNKTIQSSGDSVLANAFVIRLHVAAFLQAFVADTVALSELATRVATQSLRQLADSVPLAAALTARTTSNPRQAADLLPVADAPARAQGLQTRSCSDSIPLSDAAVGGSAGGSRSTADTLPVADVITRSSQLARSLADQVPLADVVTVSGHTSSPILAPTSAVPNSNAGSVSINVTLPPLAGGEVIFFDVAWNLTTGATMTVTPHTASGNLTLVDTATEVDVTYQTWAKVAVPADSGAQVLATLSNNAKWAADADCYPGASQTLTDHVAASAVETINQASHTMPALVITKPGSWLRECITDRATPASSSYTLPGDMVARSQNAGPGGGGSVCTDTGDSNQPLAAGTYGGEVWTGTVSTVHAIMRAVGIAPSSAGGGVSFAADSIPLSAAAARTQGLQTRASSDTVPVADAITRASQAAPRPLGVAFPGLGDALARAQAQSRPAADLLPISDAVARGPGSGARAGADSVPIADAVTRSQGVQPRVGAELLPLDDAATGTRAVSAAAADLLPLAERAASTASSTVHIVVDALPIAEQLTRRLAAARPTADLIPLSDTLVRGPSAASRQIRDAVPVTEFAVGPIANVPPPFTVRLADDRWRASTPAQPRWASRT